MNSHLSIDEVNVPKHVFNKLDPDCEECPVEHEPFGVDNPPYAYSHCIHYISFKAVQQNKVKAIYNNGVLFTTCLECELCRTYSSHVTLDVNLLNIILLKNCHVQNNVEEFEFLKYIRGGKFPKMYAPRGSLMSFLAEF
jgi:hypothetical protein